MMMAQETSIGDWSCSIRHLNGVNHRMDGMSFPPHNRIEAIMVVGDVIDDAHRTVRLHQGVRTLDDVSVSHLRLGLLVAGMRIGHTVFVLVFRVSLCGSKVF